jgi:hypothetical protein
MEILLKKLQEKGILTASEADEIAKETRKAVAEEKAEMKEAAEKAAAQKMESKEAGGKGMELPDWVKNTKFKGDLRLRYEARDRDDDARGTQGRGRFRLRAGADTTVADGVTAGFGLASGIGDQRSANQTVTNVFTRKSIWVDYAYAKYAPAKWLSLTGGKFANPIWQPSDMLISNDVNPEGAALRLDHQVGNFGLYFNGGLFVLDDRNSLSPSSTDPLLFAIQPGVKWNITKDISFRFAPAYYGTSDLKNVATLPTGGAVAQNGTGVPSASGTNTATAAGKYRFGYTGINWGGELGWNKPFGISCIPYLSVMGGYINNPDPSDDNTAYLAGVFIGSTDVKKWGDWSLEYTFRRLEKDAWLDFLPDSSFYNGNTNVMGHRVKILFGLTKNTALGLNFYDVWKVRNFNPTNSLTIPGATRTFSSEENLYQADLIFKF